MTYALRRLGVFALTAVVTLSAVFVALRVLPGDAATLSAGLDATPEVLEAARREAGLDRPIGEQYLGWLGRLARGDLGRSLREGRPVGDLVAERVQVTLSLALCTLVLSTAAGLAAGLALARRGGTRAERVLTGATQAVLAAPSFWVGLLLILLVASRLGWLPMLGYQPLEQGVLPWARHLALPVLTLALPRTAFLALSTRALVLEEAGRDHLRTALSKGVGPRRLLWGHALRAAAPGLVTLVALQVGGLLTGTIIVEEVFVLPGLGQALLGAVGARDYPVVEALTVLSLVVYALLNLAADLVAARLDPRVTYR